MFYIRHIYSHFSSCLVKVVISCSCHLPSGLSTIVFEVFGYAEGDERVDAFVQTFHAGEVESCVSLAVLVVSVYAFGKEHVYHCVVTLKRSKNEQRVSFLV